MGVRLARLEDDRLITGRGRYVADIHLPGMLEVAVVRSMFPHARLTGIRTEEARQVEGVVGVFTAADLAGVAPVPDFYSWARGVGTFPLARDRVRYVGAPVAVVVARDRYAAEDGAELVEVEYDELPVVASIDAALAADAPKLYDEWPDNRIVQAIADNPEADRAFEGRRVVGGTYTMQRHTAVPMETRGAVADARDGRVTIWSSTQFPHIARTMIATVLGLPERDVRVVAPDVGGGFGCKAEVYPEEYLAAWLARRLGAPVRWIEDRYEHLVSTGHARDTRIRLEAAVRDDGTIAALRGAIQQDVGSGEIYPAGFNPAFVAMGSLTGPYRIQEQRIDVECVVTNKTPSGAYRGFGIPEATFATERLIDRIGRELGIDPVEIRRRMTLEPEELPFESASGAVIDSGSHRAALERIVELVAAAAGEERSRHASQPNLRIGVGVASYVEGVAPTYYATSGRWTSQDAAAVRFDPDGSVTVSVGVSTAGQGLATMVATLTAESLDVPIERIRVVMGDSDVSPYGLGGWGSRSTILAGGAIVKASDVLKDKAVRIAAHLLEASVEDVALERGRFRIRGSPETSVGWDEVATTALVRTLDLPTGMDPGLEALATYDIDVDHVPNARGRMNACATYTNATHGAIVGVDVETGEVRVLRYLVAHDCGTVINPTIVEGQIHGGVAQGIGGVLWEELPYTPEGQPQATTFMDYLLPTSAEIPAISIEHFESPAPGTAFGAKGAGEAGIIGPAAVIAQAVESALSEFSIPEITETPVSSRQVLAWIGRTKGAE
jgi:carbon-monoxide dehydrogenase large subunit